MQVREMMSHPVHVVNLTTQSREAARLMRDKHIGSLPVVLVGEDDRVVGMVTERRRLNRGRSKPRPSKSSSLQGGLSEGKPDLQGGREPLVRAKFRALDRKSVRAACYSQRKRPAGRLPVPLPGRPTCASSPRTGGSLVFDSNRI